MYFHKIFFFLFKFFSIITGRLSERHASVPWTIKRITWTKDKYDEIQMVYRWHSLPFIFLECRTVSMLIISYFFQFLSQIVFIVHILFLLSQCNSVIIPASFSSSISILISPLFFYFCLIYEKICKDEWKKW